jgi:hypothetical protein
LLLAEYSIVSITLKGMRMNTTLTKIMRRIKEQSIQVRLLAVGCVVLGIAGVAGGDWTLGIVSVVAGVLALIWK